MGKHSATPGRIGNDLALPRPSRGLRRFSLIEWAVVAAIVGVLAAIIGPAGDLDFTHRFPPPPAAATRPITWAGNYYRGLGLGMSLYLCILPDGRYSYVWGTCTGVGERESGYAREIEGKIVLSPTESSATRMTRTLVPVRWGARTYLIPPEEMSDFCDEITMGEEPRPGARGKFYLDKITPGVSDVPILPRDWATYLDQHLLLGTVVEMVDSATARIDLGTDQGIVVDDVLAVQGRGRSGTRLVVTTVARDTSVARIWDPYEEKVRLTAGCKVVRSKAPP